MKIPSFNGMRWKWFGRAPAVCINRIKDRRRFGYVPFRLRVYKHCGWNGLDIQTARLLHDRLGQAIAEYEAQLS